MKLLAFFVALGLSVAAPADTVTNVFQRSEGLAIPDANPAGLTSTNIISNIPGNIQSISVTLDITGGFNGDLYAYIVFDDGFAVLLNRIGKSDTSPFGADSSGMTITLSDSSATDVHLSLDTGGSLLTGIWQPDGRNTSPQTVLTTDPRNAMLSTFNNKSPNGTWTLFVADLASGYQANLQSWEVTVVADTGSVPEPGSLSILTVVLAGFWGWHFWSSRRRQKRKAAL